MPGSSQPLFVLTSRDGGNTWTQKQVTAATNNPNSQQGFGRSGCTVRTDSHGVVYVFAYAFALGSPGARADPDDPVVRRRQHLDGPRTVADGVRHLLARSSPRSAAVSWTVSAAPGTTCRRRRRSTSPTARPTGTDATNRIVMSWVDGQTLNAEQVRFSSSDNGGTTWSAPRAIQLAGRARLLLGAGDLAERHRGVGRLQRVLDTVPGERDRTRERPSAGRRGPARRLHRIGVGAFALVHQGAAGDARGSSQNNLAAEFLGDYVYAAATPHLRRGGVERRPPTRPTAPTIDAFRQELHDIAVATGPQTAEAEEPRGAEGHDGSKAQEREVGQPPDVQASCRRHLRQQRHLRRCLGEPVGLRRPEREGGSASGRERVTAGRGPPNSHHPTWVPCRGDRRLASSGSAGCRRTAVWGAWGWVAVAAGVAAVEFATLQRSQRFSARFWRSVGMTRRSQRERGIELIYVASAAVGVALLVWSLLGLG